MFPSIRRRFPTFARASRRGGGLARSRSGERTAGSAVARAPVQRIDGDPRDPDCIPAPEPAIRDIALCRVALVSESVRKAPPEENPEIQLPGSITAHGRLKNVVARPDDAPATEASAATPADEIRSGTRPRGVPRGRPGAGVSRSFTAANGPVLHNRGAMTGATVRIVLEQEGAAGGPDFWASVPNPTTVAVIEAVWRGEVVALGSAAEAIAGLDPHARGSGEQGARRGCRSSGRRSSGAIRGA